METSEYGSAFGTIRFFLDMPPEAVAWLTGTVAFFFALAGLLSWSNGRRSGRDRPPGAARHAGGRGAAAGLWSGHVGPQWWRRLRQERIRRAVDVRELRRYAEEVAVAADRAAATAERRRVDWVAAQGAMETAWRAFEAADEALRRARAAAGFGTPRTPQTPAEYADRESYLHRTAMTAFWRGELTADELYDALAHRNGWDPRRHPFEQELFLRQVIRDRLAAQHRLAVEREQAAWRDAELARTAAGSLRAEAFTALERARRPRPVVPAAVPPARVANAGLSHAVQQPTVRLRVVRAN